MLEFECPSIPNEVIVAFRKAGFKNRKYDGQEPVFLRKDVTVNEIPYLKDYYAQDDRILDADVFSVEMSPFGVLQFCLISSDILEHGTLYPDEKGHFVEWKELAIDTGVELPGFFKDAGSLEEAQKSNDLR